MSTIFYAYVCMTHGIHGGFGDRWIKQPPTTRREARGRRDKAAAAAAPHSVQTNFPGPVNVSLAYTYRKTAVLERNIGIRVQKSLLLLLLSAPDVASKRACGDWLPGL